MSALDAAFSLAVGERGAEFKLEVRLKLERGVLALFGPSGCGKSVTLRAVVGTLTPASGQLTIDGRAVFDAGGRIAVPPHERAIGYVPQHHALFPFCNVEDNVVFGLPRARRRRIEPEIEALMDELGIAALRKAMPDRLSGGERQRVALARALTVHPRLLVLDEPFASLDIPSRAELRAVLKNTLARRGLSALLVTHDPLDVLDLADVLVRFDGPRTLPPESPTALIAWMKAVGQAPEMETRASPDKLSGSGASASIH
ncbi:MAG: ATP-binding cassette domain-containing protein [Myxococcales bacterium]|nr:ATP-binding cassette domain-containing protein [Myxococcales bacterium]